MRTYPVAENPDLIERFFRYVKIDTQSAEGAEAQPSTQKQHDLAQLLYEELCEMGVQADYDREHCYLYAVLPGEEPALGFVAHMDTSPAASGTNVLPRIEAKYQGGDIVLKPGETEAERIVLSPADFPELLAHVGEDLIVTDGTTLLGADDKAGVAEIMNLLAYYAAHPEKPHRTIRIAFTPDEEVWRGTEHFDGRRFGAKEAYTVDGGKLGEIQYECFNAASAKLEVAGRSTHPGSAKNAMLNAQNIAMEFHAMLPSQERPEHTEGYEGFYHLDTMEGGVEYTVMKYIVRDHDSERFAQRKAYLERVAAYLNEKYRRAAGGKDLLRLTLTDQYYNMAIPLQDRMDLVTRAKELLRSLGVEPYTVPVRGGTDGTVLTYRGIPCPNLCTGGYNYHGRFEYASVQEMEACAQLLILLAAV